MSPAVRSGRAPRSPHPGFSLAGRPGSWPLIGWAGPGMRSGAWHCLVSGQGRLKDVESHSWSQAVTHPASRCTHGGISGEQSEVSREWFLASIKIFFNSWNLYKTCSDCMAACMQIRVQHQWAINSLNTLQWRAAVHWPAAQCRRSSHSSASVVTPGVHFHTTFVDAVSALSPGHCVAPGPGRSL